eukprot:CAMPEP_0118918124 /NCGR_PEP_ID=MMETSP1166-20130328/17716_1 /TAXON_ID=1104430 /ORGANISM="Chrysoreinhardia sp, Strain CCMP3193" /LENGTH=769 /DNA_ID=CAMNT_0006858369 /DNA_START=17 /DNA_END=2326 /DNA_ORIENTATION=-
MMMTTKAVLLLLLLRAVSTSGLEVGVGKADGTGPSTSYVFMGMANPSQRGQGLWTRLYARAFVLKEGDARMAFVSLDAGMCGYVLKKKVLGKLGDLSAYYDETNVMISGTHTHSGSSGFLQHLIFQLAGSGWVPQVGEAMATGIANALRAAHDDLQAGGSLRVARASLEGASINRSPPAYLANPEAERNAYGSDVDLDFVTLLVERDDLGGDDDDDLGDDDSSLGDSSSLLRGVVTWFAVHPTSMNNTNTLVSSDNKGYASLLTERRNAGVVAAFASSNLGDVSPNVKGPHCMDTGRPCDFQTSTCPERVPGHPVFRIQRNEQCAAQGPGVDMFDSTRIIAEKQADLAQDMLDDAASSTTSSFDWSDPLSAKTTTSSFAVVHSYVRMPGLEVRDWETGTEVKGFLCKPALGQSFAAGTIDGPGAFGFAQNKTSKNPLWAVVAEVLADVFARNSSTYAEFAACHAPKDVFLPTGAMNFPHPWAPSVLPMQLMKIGTLVVAGVPTEMTTMAGRRMKRMLEKVFFNEANETVVAVVAGLANEYADYTTTFEEYQVQRYEGGSTIYGPHQLDAYLQEYAALARRIVRGEGGAGGGSSSSSSSSGSSDVTPEDFSADLDLWPWLKVKAARAERPPSYGNFGDVLDFNVVGSSVVVVDFVGGDLKHDLKLDDTYLEVQLLQADDASWRTVFTDADPETRITCVDEDSYKRVSIRFDVPDDVQPGDYQIVYHGNARTRQASIVAFDGVSPTFNVDKNHANSNKILSPPLVAASVEG